MIIESEFTPAWWLPGCHLQTIWPKFIRRNQAIETQTEELELPDGDFIELDWLQKPKDSRTPLVVVLHGLEGSVDSHYAKGMLMAIQQKGWAGVVMHFRNCGKKNNRLPRFYHSGETQDTRFLINELRRRYPENPMAAIGFSLGGNVLCKYQGEEGSRSPLSAAVVISAPLHLSASCDRIATGNSRIYQHYLLKMLKDNLLEKARHLDMQAHIKVDLNKIPQIKQIRQFDDWVTAPLHGFRDAADYYAQSSGLKFMGEIISPTLFIHALDDPFLSDKVIPKRNQLSTACRFEISQHGGHVGFISGTNPRRPVFWQEQRALTYIEEQL